ncbi:putative hemin transport protein [Methylobacillus rhizosphaerae]|uniref:Putative hemin transport protein n=1 Tax=Methylobacillus rhizosphaerae TaxID=551994 RepID=A0A238YN99_9PROT|nr:ChuX/HutX family heme-like substrate-binding protein [Methylobacillus rhizosphaerae]SNR71909.1 putative hemin transport protein [Methylobacillus rhizosphaerae]
MNQLAISEQQYHAFHTAKKEQKLRNREAAEAIGISEGQAIANAIGREALRLKGPFHEIIAEVPSLGRVMALTRNESTVHEKIGTYQNISFDHVGLVVGPDIDLRIFYSQWKHGYAVTEVSDKGTQRSLQFYDATGTAIHKIHLKDYSNIDGWNALVQKYRSDDQSPGQTVETAPAPPALKADHEIDQAGFQAAWLAMKDTHDFFILLRKFSVGRTQGLRLAPEGHAYKVDNHATRQMLETAAADGTSIMCFVGNPGNIQIHTGPIRNVKALGPWINVLDETFNLHLRTDLIAESWVVKKPTDDGIVTSLEVFAADGSIMAQFFGERKPGKPELETWRHIVSQLPAQQ